MSTVQTICLILGGYLVSRACLRAGLHEPWLEWLVARRGGRASGPVIALMVTACALSAFTPNAMVVLVLLPLATRLRAQLVAGGLPVRPAGTLVAAGLIYGANIGGTASLLGSPANLYLLVSLRLLDVPGREALHFVSWLLLGLPLAAGLLATGWAVLWLAEPAGMGAQLAPLRVERASRGPFGPVLRVTGAWAAGWLLLIAVGVGLPRWLPDAAWWGLPLAARPAERMPLSIVDLAGVALTVLVTLLLLWPRRAPLLEPRDLVRELPWRGLLLGALVLLLIVGLAAAGLDRRLGAWLDSHLPRGLAGWQAALLLVGLVIFLTELLNNTTVALFAFPLAKSIAQTAGEDPLPLMLAVSLATTCAFMTPIATPVNALAIGGVGRVSLWRLARAGLLLNLLVMLWIAAWTRWAVPSLLRLF